MKRNKLLILSGLAIFVVGKGTLSYGLDCSPKGATPVTFKVEKMDKGFVTVIGAEERGKKEVILGVQVIGSADEFVSGQNDQEEAVQETSCYHKAVWDGELTDGPRYVWWDCKGEICTHTFKLSHPGAGSSVRLKYAGKYELVVKINPDLKNRYWRKTTSLSSDFGP